MKVLVLKESAEGERRVAAVPATVEKMARAGMEVLVQAGAGLAAGFVDAEYQTAGAKVAGDLAGDVLLKVQRPSAEEMDRIPEGAALIAYSLQGRGAAGLREGLQRRRITAFSLDLVPRIARAQNMDVLSSMANIAGYKSALLAANALGKFFPMLMTAAGTVLPAKVFVLGAGVAGLQAVATARRLGAVVSAFDIRPAVKEQVESLGARFVGVGLDQHAEDAKGYAKEVSAETAQKERQLLLEELKATDACITTALVPGKRAPVLVTAEMVKAMRTGSVIVDLAAEQGGNCELTQPGKEIVAHGVTILGPVNLVSSMAFQASQLYSRNVLNFLLHLYDKKAGKISLDRSDEIVKGCLIAHAGEVVQQI
ncbi:MAG: Re/Si-specific NAD(P)(+) transhydrogenase subunit alpha [Deltaproteobacteria bacterium]|nr:MAG: Re/Si-specific NAD(P)(+) transhydrogenase subunit alpha [Deltaproteobacteria bacterium]